ncbi:MAG TPA: class I SAM-dependent methyltransferase [Patescibacteria group bacterium]|jgi:SAM-dependent methyltransferase|nr:class I SAM-dependent methyltransferase [Patescibacteria group bacterium]
MGYLDYYRYQAIARGIETLEDIRRDADSKTYLYDRVVLPWLPEKKSSAMAEIACGHGSFLWWLKQRQYLNVIGVDSSAEQIALARLTGATVLEMELRKWLINQPDGSLDVIVGIDLIEHISKDEFMDVLQVCRRVLGADGHLILRYPNGDSPLVGRNLFNDITHVWTYTSNCLQSLASMHGFSRVRFIDEGDAAIRDSRWLKVPLCKLSTVALRFLFRAATKEKVRYWSPNIWACLGE